MPRRKKPKMLGDRRGKNPNSLKNLRPMKPGETLNPTGINAKTPMTDEYRKCAADPIPESIREKLNARIGEEVLEPGDTWARANALRRFIDAVRERAECDPPRKSGKQSKVLRRIASRLRPAVPFPLTGHRSYLYQ
jgi:hypothetical protein